MSLTEERAFSSLSQWCEWMMIFITLSSLKTIDSLAQKIYKTQRSHELELPIPISPALSVLPIGTKRKPFNTTRKCSTYLKSSTYLEAASGALILQPSLSFPRGRADSAAPPPNMGLGSRGSKARDFQETGQPKSRWSGEWAGLAGTSAAMEIVCWLHSSLHLVMKEVDADEDEAHLLRSPQLLLLCPGGCSGTFGWLQIEDGDRTLFEARTVSLLTRPACQASAFRVCRTTATFPVSSYSWHKGFWIISNWG